MSKSLLLSAVATMVIASTSVNADEISSLKAQLQELNKRTETLENNTKTNTEQTQALADELINTQNATSFGTVDISKTEAGLGVAASKVYYSKNPLSIGGYGEIHFSRYANNATNETETTRFVPYIGYKFSDNIILNSEIEFEHGGQEVSVEQLYLDFLIDPAFSVRIGHQVVPMGLINLNHEPILFNTVNRPDVETYIIPSTWHENGITIHGKTDILNYYIGAIVALDMGLAEHDGSLDKDTYGINWIRNGRRGGYERNSRTSNLGFVARIDYTGINGLLVGTSLYTGDAGPSTNGKEPGRLTIGELHAQYQTDGFKIKGLYTQAHLSHADAYLGVHTVGDTSLVFPTHPKLADGGYINLEYNILSHLTQTTTQLPIFFQYENYNLANSVVGEAAFGTTESFTYGMNYFPHPQVVLKGEYTMRHNKNDSNSANYANEGIYSFALGFIF
ncbi:porin [Sulfurimonas sp.]|uniref:porin n=1 Tax=Sulfurimonas sp. TaxID=2022749 RepID=UPI0026004FE3|nr:porin [Sulfurimonas sp.]